MRSKSTAGYERYKVLKPTIPPNSFHAKHNINSNDNMRFASVGKNEDLEDDFSWVKYFTLSYAHNNTVIKL